MASHLGHPANPHTQATLQWILPSRLGHPVITLRLPCDNVWSPTPYSKSSHTPELPCCQLLRVAIAYIQKGLLHPLDV
jgi:hypothetical protein